MLKAIFIFGIIFCQGHVFAQGKTAETTTQDGAANPVDSATKPIEQPAVVQEKQESRHSIEVNYLPGGIFNFPSLLAGVSTGNATYSINSGFGIRYFSGYTKRNSWNTLFGIGFDSARSVGTVSGQIGGTPFSGTGGGTHSSFQLHFRFDYRWENWIFDIGFNYCQPQNSGTPAAWNSMAGSIGTEVGLQYAFTDEHILSIQSRAMTVSASPVGSTNLGMGTLSDLLIGFRFKF